MRQASQEQFFDALRGEEDLVAVVRLLRKAGVEPLLVKGWSIGRLYPENARPYGDIDLCVADDSMEAASAALGVAGVKSRRVDLHAGIADLADRGWQEVFRRSRLVPLGEFDIRILGAEDQLRHLCLHLLRHGAFRALWLCDVAVALESLPADFDWDYCLSGRRSLSDWVLCTLGLAQRLLDAHVPAVIADRVQSLPDWLERTVLKLWGQGLFASDVATVGIPFLHPRSWGRMGWALRQRWPNPIRAAFKLGLSPYTRLPLSAIQIAAFAKRAGQSAASRLQRPKFASLPRMFDIHPAQIR